MPQQTELEIEPGLVEEAVLGELRRRRDRRQGAVAREYARRVRELRTCERHPEVRERHLRALQRELFVRFGFEAFLRDRLQETPGGYLTRQRVRVRRAYTPADEGAELSRPQGPLGRRAGLEVALRLRPESLAAPAEALAGLRQDLLRVSDMLDPTFGYSPELPQDLPAAKRALVQERFQSLWKLSVACRLAERGKLDPGTGPDPTTLLRRALPFSSVAERATVLERLKASPAPSCQELLSWVSQVFTVAEPSPKRGRSVGEHRGPGKEAGAGLPGVAE